MQDIKNLQEISEGKVILFISSETCGWCTKIQPVVDEFEVKYPDVKVLKIMSKDLISEGKLNPEISAVTGGKLSTPTFIFFNNKVAYNLLANGSADLATFEKYYEGKQEQQSHTCPHEARVKELEAELKTANKTIVDQILFLREMLLKK